MERIYFDKQIFSHLFKGENPIYQSFFSDLLNNKDKFLYCYSHGHLLDLKNDKTDTKYAELDFISKLVNDNYLSYHATEKRTSCFLAKPIEAFEDVDVDDEPLSFATLFDELDLNLATPEQRDKIKLAKESLLTRKIDFGFPKLDDIPKEFLETLKKILPIGQGSMTLVEWMEHFMGMLKTMEEDKKVYKDLRNVVDKSINNGKFTLEYESIDFNDDLKNSVLQKSFIDYVNSNLNPEGTKQISNYDFYTNAYFTLDLLGISKEPSKNVKFKNILNDSYHSYYGAYCDYVVSDDNGFLKKTKALYRLLGIETKVYHINDFIKLFGLLVKSFESSSDVFFKLLTNDIKNGLILEQTNSLKYNRRTTKIKPIHNYFGHFNRLEIVAEENDDFILLRRKTKNYSAFSFFREYEGLINWAFRIFGYDLNNKGEFNFEKEIIEINNGTWAGRYWDLGTLTILIEINKGINEFCLLITPRVNSRE